MNKDESCCMYSMYNGDELGVEDDTTSRGSLHVMLQP